jgi:hypothetical protein
VGETTAADGQPAAADGQPVAADGEPAGDARFWSEARDNLDRLEVIHAAWRFAGLRAAVPEPEDWDPDHGWPTADEAEEVFGSWDEMLDASGLDDAVIGEILEKALEANTRMTEREKELERGQHKLEEDGRRVPELRRREELARTKRDEADEARATAEAERDRLARDNEALAMRIAALEDDTAELRASAAGREGQAPAEAETLEALERALDMQHAAESARDTLQGRLDAQFTEREGDRRTIAELMRLLAAVDAQASEIPAEAEAETPPVSVLEAVERAAAQATHLRFAPKAFETAADSPFRRPGLILRTLRALDEIAAQFAEGDMGRSLGQAAAEHGITHWRPDVAETTRKRYEDEYSFVLEGRKLWVGPHIGLGSGSGAQFIARIYLHVSDGHDPELPRGITVAVVGRHLPDTTT